MKRLLLSALLCSIGAPPAPDATHGVEITYLGNEGFLVTGGGKKVLIDALFRKGVEGYAVHSAAVLERLERATVPFDGVDLVLATHFHADHFDAEAVAEHLTHNPQALFVSTNQARDQLKALDQFAALKDRVTAMAPNEGERIESTIRGVRLQSLNIHHGRGRPVENLGFIVELGGRRLLHIGDSEAEAAVFRRYGLATDRIDVAFLPYWYFLDDTQKQAVRAHINPRHVVLMHVPPNADAFDDAIRKRGGWRTLRTQIKEEFPGAVFLEKEMDATSLN